MPLLTPHIVTREQNSFGAQTSYDSRRNHSNNFKTPLDQKRQIGEKISANISKNLVLAKKLAAKRANQKATRLREVTLQFCYEKAKDF